MFVFLEPQSGVFTLSGVCFMIVFMLFLRCLYCDFYAVWDIMGPCWTLWDHQ